MAQQVGQKVQKLWYWLLQQEYYPLLAPDQELFDGESYWFDPDDLGCVHVGDGHGHGDLCHCQNGHYDHFIFTDCYRADY